MKMASLPLLMQSGKYMGFGAVLAPVCINSITLGKLFGLYEFQFCHLKHGDDHDFL